ncbi:MAG: hypothetical protein V4544_03550 [Pseudomonadota bacterium]
MFRKLRRLKSMVNKKSIIYVFVPLLVLIILIPFTFVLKLFLLLASITLAVSLWIKWENFFSEKKRTLNKRQASERIRNNKDPHGY